MNGLWSQEGAELAQSARQVRALWNEPGALARAPTAWRCPWEVSACCSCHLNTVSVQEGKESRGQHVPSNPEIVRHQLCRFVRRLLREQEGTTATESPVRGTRTQRPSARTSSPKGFRKSFVETGLDFVIPVATGKWH